MTDGLVDAEVRVINSINIKFNRLQLKLKMTVRPDTSYNGTIGLL